MWVGDHSRQAKKITIENQCFIDNYLELLIAEKYESKKQSKLSSFQYNMSCFLS